MTIRQAMFVLLAFLMPAPALADLTVTYGAPRAAFTMTIEIAANGDLRGDVGRPGTYFITRAGHGYFITDSPSGPLVMRVEDMATVMAEQMGKLDPHFREEMEGAPALDLVEKGTVVINGRTGSAWYLKLQDGQLSPKPWVVISHDPELAPLGRAMAVQFDMSTAMMGGIMGTGPFKVMQDIFKTGAPISFADSEVKTVSNAPIPSGHFELPAQPAALDAVRKHMTPATPKP